MMISENSPRRLLNLLDVGIHYPVLHNENMPGLPGAKESVLVSFVDVAAGAAIEAVKTTLAVENH